MFVTVIIFLLILSLLVLVHELGHFIVAKLLNIKVEEFGFGFPPRAFSFKYGETLYSINWLPIGGFVKLYGEDEAGGGKIAAPSQPAADSKDINRAFFARPVWQRALVVVAGVVMNFALAVTLISILFSVVGIAIPINKVQVDAVIKGAPADKAGLKIGDTIVSVNGKQIKNAQEVIDSTKNNLGKSIKVGVKTGKGVDESLTLTPRKNYPSDQGPMGVAISQASVLKKYPWYQAPFVGTREALKESWLIASGLGSLLVQLITKGAVPQDVAGPVGIAQLTGRVVQIGPAAVLSFISLLSLNLAIINILPIPALDGGRLFFILFEAVTRKKVNSTFESYAHTIGMVLLLALIALITIHDLIRVFTGQSILPK
jgi:regulator of sigma E protease